MKHQRILYAFATVSSFATPFTAFAASAITLSGLCGKFEQFKNIVVVVIGIFAILSILYSAFLFLTGGGDEEKQKKAKAFLIYGLVGIAVALFAFAAVESIAGLIPGLTAADLRTGCAQGI